MPSRPPIITRIDTIDGMKQLLESNPGLVVIKFGATWCGPCKRIEKLVHTTFSMMPVHVQCVILDIDECVEVYLSLKRVRMVPGVPTILAYKKGNTTLIPDFSVVGADNNELSIFFNKCLEV